MIRHVIAVLACSAPLHAQSLPVINYPSPNYPNPNYSNSGVSSAAPASSPAPRRAGQAQVMRSSDGHFYVNAMLNSTPVHMLVDTGASTIVLRSDDAIKAGLNPESLIYSIPTSTANGNTYSARTRVQTLIVGGITQHDVPVMVSRPGALSTSLLGQSFLSQLSGFRISGNELVLQAD